MQAQLENVTSEDQEAGLHQVQDASVVPSKDSPDFWGWLGDVAGGEIVRPPPDFGWPVGDKPAKDNSALLAELVKKHASSIVVKNNVKPMIADGMVVTVNAGITIEPLKLEVLPPYTDIVCGDMATVGIPPFGSVAAIVVSETPRFMNVGDFTPAKNITIALHPGC